MTASPGLPGAHFDWCDGAECRAHAGGPHRSRRWELPAGQGRRLSAQLVAELGGVPRVAVAVGRGMGVVVAVSAGEVRAFAAQLLLFWELLRDSALRDGDGDVPAGDGS